MTLRQAINKILNDCPICGCHSDAYADMHCSSDHARLRDALQNDPAHHEIQTLRDEIEAHEHQISNLKERLDRIAGCAQVISSEMAHIDDAVSLNG